MERASALVTASNSSWGERGSARGFQAAGAMVCEEACGGSARERRRGRRALFVVRAAGTGATKAAILMACFPEHWAVRASHATRVFASRSGRERGDRSIEREVGTRGETRVRACLERPVLNSTRRSNGARPCAPCAQRRHRQGVGHRLLRGAVRGRCVSGEPLAPPALPPHAAPPFLSPALPAPVLADQRWMSGQFLAREVVRGWIGGGNRLRKMSPRRKPPPPRLLPPPPARHSSQPAASSRLTFGCRVGEEGD